MAELGSKLFLLIAALSVSCLICQVLGKKVKLIFLLTVLNNIVFIKKEPWCSG